MTDLIELARKNPTIDLFKQLGAYLKDEDITEVMVNADGRVWVDSRTSGLKCTDTTMEKESIETIIHRIASKVNYELDKNTPSVAAMIPELKIRFQGIVKPAAAEGAFFTMRKQADGIFTLDDYVNAGAMTINQAESLRSHVLERKNILIGGGVGCGKTTLLNALLHEIAPMNHRCLIIEDTQELQYQDGLNYVRLSTADAFKYNGRLAVFDALRSRPDRILYGEVRDGSTALELLKGWNTGQRGGMATIHADNAEQMLDRVYELLQEVQETPSVNQIMRSIDICVYIERVEGKRRISPLAQVVKPKEKPWNVKHELI